MSRIICNQNYNNKLQCQYIPFLLPWENFVIGGKFEIVAQYLSPARVVCMAELVHAQQLKLGSVNDQMTMLCMGMNKKAALVDIEKQYPHQYRDKAWNMKMGFYIFRQVQPDLGISFDRAKPEPLIYPQP